MERLFNYLIAGCIIISAAKIFIYWIIQKLLHPKAPDKRTKLMNSRAEATSKMFNTLLKSKKLDYPSINSIYKILKRYAGNKRYNNNIHLIYSTLKHSAIRNQDLAQIQFILDCAKCRKAK